MLDLVELFAKKYMLTRNELKQLAEIKCNDLYYYCNKCDEKHKLATEIGREHVEYADAIHCRCDNIGRCNKYNLRFDFGYTVNEVHEALEALSKHMFADVGKMLKTLEDILDGGEFELKVGIDNTGCLTTGTLSLCSFRFKIKVKVEEVDVISLREDLLREPSKYLRIYRHIFNRLPTGAKEKYEKAYENWKMLLDHPIVAMLMIGRG